MRVKTEQRLGFADLEVDLADTELSSLESMIDWGCMAELLDGVRGDYDPLSLFKMLCRLGTTYQMNPSHKR